MGIRKANNQGLVITTAGPDVCHLMPAVNPTTVIIRKIMWYNNTGAQETLIFGTQDNAVPAAGWVPLFPTINCVNTMDGELMEWEIPEIEFVVDNRAGVAGQTGDILVQASAVGIEVRLEVEEFREGR